MDHSEWLDIITSFDIPITSYYLIDDKMCYWSEYIEKRITENSRRVKCVLSG